MFPYSVGSIRNGGSFDCDVRNQMSNGIHVKTNYHTKRLQILKIRPG